VALTVQDRSGNKLDREVTYDVQVGQTTIIGGATP
jgi:hypothetical protein